MRKQTKATKPAGILAATVAGVPLGTPVPAVAPVATKPTKPVKPEAAPKAVKPAPVKFGPFTGGNVGRTASTVAANRTAFGGVTSNRDEAYLALFATVAKAADDGRTITLAKLAERGTNAFYTGSAKPHDAGAINRARKAGNVAVSDDGSSLTLTEAGGKLASAIVAKLAKPVTGNA